MLPFHDPWFAYGVPTVALALGLVALIASREMARRFDKRFPPRF